ncbi:hypothetical protein TRP66_09300 [Pseudomonas sp. JDS28PS106]|uniref:hypothetical protein n=1 Tax=Pseudomonas sp. JDS28PS106 TaxID=2497235 RepID=UPI002FD2FD1C
MGVVSPIEVSGTIKPAHSSCPFLSASVIPQQDVHIGQWQIQQYPFSFAHPTDSRHSRKDGFLVSLRAVLRDLRY